MKSVYGQAADTIIIVVACYTIGRDKTLSYTTTRLHYNHGALHVELVIADLVHQDTTSVVTPYL